MQVASPNPSPANPGNRVIIFGGTGFIGLSLAQHLQSKGLHPILIARHPIKDLPFDFVQWDARSLGSWTETLEEALAIINLTGKSVDCIKTPDNCDLILRSRVESTRIIGQAMQKAANGPKIWIQMSTAHIYGDPPRALCTEESALGYGLAPFVGQAWEQALLDYLPEGVREVRLRTSFVIGKNGGALSSLKRIVRLGLGGKSGKGTQGMSWIHEQDMNEIIFQAIRQEHWQGAYIASAPHPASNREFMRALRKQMKIPIGLPAPAWMVRFGAHNFFKTDPELALFGRYVKSERLEKEGFSFQFPKLEDALADLV